MIFFTKLRDLIFIVRIRVIFGHDSHLPEPIMKTFQWQNMLHYIIEVDAV